MNYRLLIQYDGTRYDGWQRQKTTGSTIQGKIEDVLGRMTGSGGNQGSQQDRRRRSCQRAGGECSASGRVYSRGDKGLPKPLPAGGYRCVGGKEVSDRFHSRLNAGRRHISTGFPQIPLKMFLSESIFMI